MYRHSLVVRMTHWAGVLCLTVLLMSGLQIFNAHPALYWGEASNFVQPVASIETVVRDGRRIGVTEVFGHQVVTTGVLGLSGSGDARQERAFPQWITLPSEQDLATGRRWHFFFAWLLVLDGVLYVLLGIWRGHFWRDLVPSREQQKHIGRTLVDHLYLRFPRGDEDMHYNVVQQLTYLVIVFVVLPLQVLAGLAMSPALDAAFPFLTSVFDGRQTARTVHFLLACVLVAFVVVHVTMLLVSGPWNKLRSMITGWYAIKANGAGRER